MTKYSSGESFGMGFCSAIIWMMTGLYAYFVCNGPKESLGQGIFGVAFLSAIATIFMIYGIIKTWN